MINPKNSLWLQFMRKDTNKTFNLIIDKDEFECQMFDDTACCVHSGKSKESLNEAIENCKDNFVNGVEHS